MLNEQLYESIKRSEQVTVVNSTCERKGEVNVNCLLIKTSSWLWFAMSELDEARKNIAAAQPFSIGPLIMGTLLHGALKKVKYKYLN